MVNYFWVFVKTRFDCLGANFLNLVDLIPAGSFDFSSSYTFFYKTLSYEIQGLFVITRSKCALDRRTILCLYAPGFQRQVF